MVSRLEEEWDWIFPQLPTTIKKFYFLKREEGFYQYTIKQTAAAREAVTATTIFYFDQDGSYGKNYEGKDRGPERRTFSKALLSRFAKEGWDPPGQENNPADDYSG